MKLKYSELKKKKIASIRKLKKELNIASQSPERKLWFAVLERAILDIGLRDLVRPYNKHHFNSDRFFQRTETLAEICDILGTKLDVVINTLITAGAWPLPSDYYVI